MSTSHFSNRGREKQQSDIEENLRNNTNVLDHQSNMKALYLDI